MSFAKGSFGYLRKQTKKAAWITVLLFLMSAIVFVLGIYTKGIQASGLTASEALRSNPFEILRQGDKKNLLTIVAVIGVLPAARYLVNLILLLKAVKSTAPEALYEKCEAARGKVTVLYDLYLTGYQRSYPLYCAYAGNKELLGLLAENCGAAAEAEEHIRELLKKDGQKGVTVKVFTEEGKFLERLKGEAARRTGEEKDPDAKSEKEDATKNSEAKEEEGATKTSESMNDSLRLLLQISL